MAQGFAFQVEGRDGDARAGTLRTPHGEVPTPAFMPVATYGAVRGLSVGELRGVGARLLLANTYHLHERPGEEVVAGLGGLHGFTGWRGPWLTDSGGFQVTSLADRMTVDERGVSFRSPLDGRHRELTPEDAVAIQEALGADVAMVLDECRPLDYLGSDPADPAAERRTRETLERTLRWARRCRDARRRPDQALFGIVQGGVFPALRTASAGATAELGFEGYAHGGLGLGEEAHRREDLIRAAQEALPGDAPRYLMGIGRPQDLLAGVAAGIDLFDCVVPTRNGRHGVVFSGGGSLRLKNARFARDERPIDETCDCPACRDHSRAYLRHLLGHNEMLGARLASLHNLRFVFRLLGDARRAVLEGRLERFLRVRRAALEEAAAADGSADGSGA